MNKSTLKNLKIFSFMVTIAMSSVAFASDLSPDDDLDARASRADEVSVGFFNRADGRLRRLGSGKEYNKLLQVDLGNLRNRGGVPLNFHLCKISEVLDRVRTLLKEDVSGLLVEIAQQSGDEDKKDIAKIFTGMLKEDQNLEDISIHNILQGKQKELLSDLIIRVFQGDYAQYNAHTFNPQTLTMSRITGADGREVAAKAIIREMLSEFNTKIWHIKPSEMVKSATKCA